MSLECNHCGIEVIEPHPDGLYYDDDTAICPECGCETRVVVNEEYVDDEDVGSVSADTSEDPINWGQCQCDGTCDLAVPTWVAEGHLCRLDCKRIDEATRARVRALIEAGKSAEEIEEQGTASGQEEE